MSIVYSGTFSRSGGILHAIAKQVNQVNLKPVKRIQIQFDPFHANAYNIREFLFHISKAAVLDTNLNCTVKTNVVCDRSEPQIKVDLGQAGKLTFLANNLTTLELFQLLNKHLLPLIPKEEEPTNVLAAKIKQKVQRR